MGRAVDEVARLLGKPLMPWQRHVADVILEIDPDTGQLAYQEFGLTVPRQSGKSTLILAKAVHRCLAREFFGSRQKVVYTAQTRQKAREKWEEDYVADLKAAKALDGRFTVYLGAGREQIRFSTGSKLGIEATTEKAGHGLIIDEAYLDEAFSHVDWRSEQAFRPAMITRRNKQLGWLSTAGWTDGSPYLQAKVAKGRELADMGVREGLAYFEWSAPGDADPSDRRVWAGCMPALGHTINVQAIAAEHATLELREFRRAYLNQWVSSLDRGEWQVISESAWRSLVDRGSQISGTLALAVHMSSKRDAAVVAAAGRRADGLLHVEVVDYKPGSDWVVDRVVELQRKYRPCAVVIDEKGPAVSEIRKLQDAGVTVEHPTFAQLAAQCGRVFDLCQSEQRGLRHLGQPPLDKAVAGAATRPLGDSWAWQYDRNVEADISPLVAVTLAAWGHAVKGQSAFFAAWR